MTTQPAEFTLDFLEWTPWIELVDPLTATPEQVATIERLGEWASSSPFALTLVHDAAVFDQRSGLSDASMGDSGDEGGLPRSDREFAALVESRVNGCVFCASVHGRASIELGGDEEAVRCIVTQGIGADLDERHAAITAFSAKLAATPPQVGPDDVRALRTAGLSDLEVFDLVHAVAQFAWANRTMLTLGEPGDRVSAFRSV